MSLKGLNVTLYPVQPVESWSPGLIWVRHRHPGHLAEVLLEGLLGPADGQTGTRRKTGWIWKLWSFMSGMTEGRTAHRSALTKTISNFWPDSLMVRYDSTRTRVKLRQGGHWWRRKMAVMKYVADRMKCDVSTGVSEALKVPALISAFCYSAYFFCPSLSSLSRVLLFRCFQVGFPPKGLGGD